VSVTKEQLLKVIEILQKQVDEERRLRDDCLQEMLRVRTLTEEELAERIQKILEFPG